mmetsp:Transcript_28246/g.69559  ORF Transcript_28246/g.69559 Transcript_28246/m.69559 type:complete len:249 (+) Transcript_28246:549-1295(+)
MVTSASSTSPPRASSTMAPRSASTPSAAASISTLNLVPVARTAPAGSVAWVLSTKSYPGERTAPPLPPSSCPITWFFASWRRRRMASSRAACLSRATRTNASRACSSTTVSSPAGPCAPARLMFNAMCAWNAAVIMGPHRTDSYSIASMGVESRCSMRASKSSPLGGGRSAASPRMPATMAWSSSTAASTTAARSAASFACRAFMRSYRMPVFRFRGLSSSELAFWSPPAPPEPAARVTTPTDPRRLC